MPKKKNCTINLIKKVWADFYFYHKFQIQWFWLKNWLLDEALYHKLSYGKIWVVKDHKSEEKTKDLPLMIPIEIIDLALTMLSEKKSRKSELMKIILDVQEKNDKKVKELMQEEENKSNMWGNCEAPQAPDGFKLGWVPI